MIHIFGPRVPRTRRFGGTAVSTFVHVGLIASAVMATQSTGPLSRAAVGITKEHLIVVTPALFMSAPRRERAPAPTPSRAHAAMPAARGPVANPLKFALPDATAMAALGSMTFDVPKVDLDAGVDTLTRAWLDAPADVVAGIRSTLPTDLIGNRAQPRAAGAYSVDMVESAVAPLPDNPKPDYPPSLLSAGIEQEFRVEFVVDSTGRVDEHTVTIPSSVHYLFAEAVRVALHASRYLPARLAGEHVSQLVSQEFKFHIANR